jgi:hypothetical protein
MCLRVLLVSFMAKPPLFTPASHTPLFPASVACRLAWISSFSSFLHQPVNRYVEPLCLPPSAPTRHHLLRVRLGIPPIAILDIIFFP